MADIKTKDSKPKFIKSLDKTVAWTERVKDPIVYAKEKSKDATNDDTNINDYGDDKIKYVSNRTTDEVLYTTKKVNHQAVEYVKDRYKKNRLIKAKAKSVNNTIKNTKKTIKTSKNTIKNTKKAAKETVKASKRIAEQGRKLAIEGTKKAVTVTKAAVKATISAIKGIIAGVKSLIAMLSAGGVLAVIAIIIICLVGLVVGSIFGIFFSNEDTGTGITTNNVVAQLNFELSLKISLIKVTNIYDDYVINYNPAEWRNILAIYTVKVTKGVNDTDVVTYNDVKINALKQVYWDMNEITSYVQEEEIEEYISDDKEPKKVKKKILHIDINGRSVNEMIDYYKFSQTQQKQLDELLSSQYEKVWTPTIYGSLIGDSIMVQIALTQVGNIGGEKYWRWYGFEERVEWCAIFVSWVANESGILNISVPKFSSVGDGVEWFKKNGKYEKQGYIPKAGDLIFFDWEQDGKANHVGIVEKVENNIIYTVEGNSTNDECCKKEYDLLSNVIFGYGVV